MSKDKLPPFSYTLTITNNGNGRKATRDGGGDEYELRAELKEHGQHLESGDDWHELYDEDDDDE